MTIPNKKQALLLVSGHVQGVFFRAHAREEAEKLGLFGHAKNLPDGRVEILLQGSEEKIKDFIEWAKNGSPKAEVSDIFITWQDLEKERKTFSIF